MNSKNGLNIGVWSPAPETIEPKVKILTLELVQLIWAVQATLCLSDRLLSF